MITKIHLRNMKGITGSFDLGKVTNLYGPNGSGKSAILEGLKIGLTGYTDLGKLPGKTFQLASDKVMSVILESDDGQTLERRFERAGSGAKQVVALNGEVVKEAELILPSSLSFPVEAIHPSEFLVLSGDKRADFVFSSLSADINTITPDDLPDVPMLGKPMSFADLLKALKDKLSETEQEIKRCTANVQKLTGEMESVPAGNLKEWESQKKADQTELEKLLSDMARNQEKVNLAKGINDQRMRLEKAVSDAEAKIKNSTQRIEWLKTKIRAVDPVDPGVTEKLIRQIAKVGDEQRDFERANQEIAKRLKAFEEYGKCPFCSAKADDLGDAIDQWELDQLNNTTRIEALRQLLETLNQELGGVKEAVEVAHKNQEVEREIKVENDALSHYRNFLSQNMQELQSLNAEHTETPTSPEIIQGQIEGIRSRIAESDQNIKKFVSIQALRNKKSEAVEENNALSSRKDFLKQTIEDAKKLRDERLEQATASILKPFQTIVKSAFGCPAFVALSRGEKPCFEFGIVRGRQEIGFDTLSGGERTILLSALVASIQIIKTGRAGIGLFELAEADSVSVRGLIAAATEIEFEQIVIASCHGTLIPDVTNHEMRRES